MEIRDLARLDLNLLVALQALLEERNVSRAADRVFITQSAMSKTLSRLREVFDDQLFTRTANGMLPTPRAEEIASKLPALLQCVHHLVRPPEFNPATYQGSINVVVPEFIDVWALPMLASRLSLMAPELHLRTQAGDHRQLEMLATGELDFAIQLNREVWPDGIQAISLGFAPPRLFVREGHPLDGLACSWEEINSFPHIGLNIPERQRAILSETYLKSSFVQNELSREPHITTNHVITALEVVRQTDYIFVGPPLMAELEDFHRSITNLQLPAEDEINFLFVLIYHQRIADSPAHNFLRDLLLEVTERWRITHALPPLQQMREAHQLSY